MTEFHKFRKESPRLRPMCKQCTREYFRLWYKTLPLDVSQEMGRAKRAKRRAIREGGEA